MSSGNQINYKQKYQELKMKYMESVDAAFRLGFEQGAQQAAQDQMMMQQQQAQAAAQGGGADFSGNGAEGSPAGAEQQANPGAGQIGQPDSENPAGSELDQHISKLESMLKSETPSDPKELILLTGKIQGLRKSMALAVEMKKSDMAIPAIARALHKPEFKMGKVASHNLTTAAKAGVEMQHKIVNDIMKAFDEEEKAAATKVNAVLAVEGLIKKEGGK